LLFQIRQLVPLRHGARRDNNGGDDDMHVGGGDGDGDKPVRMTKVGGLYSCC
jgi:hypothetical protein